MSDDNDGFWKTLAKRDDLFMIMVAVGITVSLVFEAIFR